MQTLGLSDSTTRTESRLKSLFWPSIQSGADVDYLAVQGFWVCTIVGAMSMAFLVFNRQPITGLLIFLLFHFGGIGVREHNPFAAAITLIYYLVDFLASFIVLLLNSPGIGVVKVIVTALLLRISALHGSRAIGSPTQKKRRCLRVSETRSLTNSPTNGRHSSGQR
jgi:hypothetical protein